MSDEEPPPVQPLPLRQRPVSLWLLTMLALSGTVGMYIFVPALPLAAHDLGASPLALQLTISLYIAGLAAGQLVYGPASDRFGRRPVLLAGLLLFTGASLVATWAASVDVLLAARLVQGFGGSVGLVLGRAMVRDTAGFGDMARRLALMNMMVTIGPGIAPILGAVLAASLGWRSILFALALLGLANLLFGWLKLHETRPTPQAGAASWASLRYGYRQLLRSPVFLAYAVGGGFATTSVYGFFAAAPFILGQQMQRSGHEVGLFLTMQVSGLWFGSFLATRLIPRHTLHVLVVVASAVCLLTGAAFLAMAALDALNLLGVAGVMFLFTVGVGLAAPTALALAINVQPSVAGAASGIYGFSQMAVGAVCSALVGLGSNPAISTGLVLVAAGLISQMSFRVAGAARASAMASR